MLTNRLSIILCFSLPVLAMAPATTSGAEHDHTAHAHITEPVPPPAQRWAADDTLRKNMSRIHTVLEEMRRYETGQMEAAVALERVDVIEKAAVDIFAKCKLEPEQDAVLHSMLVLLLAAVNRFKVNPRDMSQLAAMHKSVEQYPQYFDAPDWTVPATHAQ